MYIRNIDRMALEKTLIQQNRSEKCPGSTCSFNTPLLDQITFETNENFLSSSILA